MCFRLLHTLHHCGFIEKIDERNYRLMAVIRPRKWFRIGYASQGQDSSFPREVHAGLLRAAERERLELIVVDNRYQPKVALRNAQHLIKEKVDLVIEFQTDEAVAPAIASKYLEADIPLMRSTSPIRVRRISARTTIRLDCSGGVIWGSTRTRAGTETSMKS